MMIGNDVRITRCRRILPGARIGDDVIISAGAVVGGDVPPQTVGVGGPEKLIRRCFDAVTIARLARVAWWEWPTDHSLTYGAVINGGEIAALERAAARVQC